MNYSDQNIAVFVDGRAFQAATKALKFDVDFNHLREFFAGKGRLLRAAYFTPVPDRPSAPFPARPLLDYLSYHGWDVTEKPVPTSRDGGKSNLRGDSDVEMAMAIVRLQPVIAHAYLCTGKSDFLPVVEHLQQCGTSVTIVSSLQTDPPCVSDALRRQADNFIEVAHLRTAVEKRTQAAG